MGWTVGIDSGSTMCKAVLFEGNNMVDQYLTKTGWNPALSAEEALNTLLDRGRQGFRRHIIKRGDVRVVATGYGREAISFADATYTEITCHALGAAFLAPEIGGVIDIGGQDSKVIRLEKGKPADFLMNDKCAAGTGRFLTMACDVLGINLEEIDDFAHPTESVHITSMCTVFAETEIISSLAARADRGMILAGVLQSIAQRAHQMTAKMGFDGTNPLLMTGGLARSNMLVSAIAKVTGFVVKTDQNAQFAGAIGACVKEIENG
ncbi:MAG: acyl-CoA dehydratase activase [Defluviitaleaceae bacterium]|nr:acyl-CoA dehydratase activase [Defluviitaleaceae bacterium]